MALWWLLIRSRLGLGPVVGFCLVFALTVASLVDGLAGPSYDLSGLSAVTAPGLMTAFVMTLAASEVEDVEAVARPLPQLLTAATLMLATAAGAGMLAALPTRPSPIGAEYGDVELARNFFLYLAVGLLPATIGVWKAAPYVVAGATIVLTGIFGITRSSNPLLWPAQVAHSSTEVWVAVGLALAVSLAVIWRCRR